MNQITQANYLQLLFLSMHSPGSKVCVQKKWMNKWRPSSCNISGKDEKVSQKVYICVSLLFHVGTVFENLLDFMQFMVLHFTNTALPLISIMREEVLLKNLELTRAGYKMENTSTRRDGRTIQGLMHKWEEMGATIKVLTATHRITVVMLTPQNQLKQVLLTFICIAVCSLFWVQMPKMLNMFQTK